VRRLIRRTMPSVLVGAAVLLGLGCGGGAEESAPPPAPKRFPAPIFDDLSLGMTRDAVARLHPIRPARTAAGRARRVWIYERRGEYAAELTFASPERSAPLKRIDVHYGPSDSGAEPFIRRLESRLGAPDVRRREADINAYGDRAHQQYDTIWTDATQTVFLTERVPAEGMRGRPAYFLTVKERAIKAPGPPTGYVPPPPPVDENGKPLEEPAF